MPACFSLRNFNVSFEALKLRGLILAGLALFDRFTAGLRLRSELPIGFIAVRIAPGGETTGKLPLQSSASVLKQ